MRTMADRIRYTLLYEVLGLALVVPGGRLLLGITMFDMGMIGLGSTIVAVSWNYLFSWLFDHTMLRIKGTAGKSLADRVIHAVLYQVGLIALLVPAIAFCLGRRLLAAFLANIGLTLFYLAYNFVFTWAYDVLFPPPAAMIEQT